MLRVPQEVLLLTLHRASLAKYMLLEIVKEVNLQATSLLIPSTVLKMQT